MLTLVYGGSGSGKSAFAEQLCLQQKREGDMLYYLATMEACDGECDRKIQRHRQLRDGKGFVTAEQACDIHKSSFGSEPVRQRVVLLECLTTLLTNEVYRENYRYREVANRVWADLQQLCVQCRDLIVVSSDVFRSGETYSAETEGYIRQLGWLHSRLAEQADYVYEVVAGIPLCVKEREARVE